MRLELLGPGTRTTIKLLPESQCFSSVPNAGLGVKRPDLTVPLVDFSRASFRRKLNGDIRNAWRGWERKNMPEWERKEGLAGFARANHLLEELSAKQQEAITAIFPESGGHNSVKEAAGKLRKSVPAIRGALKQGIKQLESKETTGKFLKQGRRRSRPIEEVSGQEKQPTKHDQERRRKEDADWARANGYLKISLIESKSSSRSSREPLSDTQKKVLDATYPSDGSYRTWEKIKDQFKFSDKRYYQILATGDKNIVLTREGKLRRIGRSKKPGTRKSFPTDKYLRESKAISVTGKMGAPKKTVDEKELLFQINQGNNINQVAAYFHLSWQTMARIYQEHGVPITKARMGRLPKIQQIISA